MPGPPSGQDAPSFVELVPFGGRKIDPLREVPSEHRSAPEERPWIYTNMITTLDGASAVEGLSGGLGGPSDRRMFRALRSVADAILVGSATAMSERYQPARPNQAGKRPPIVILTTALHLDIDLPLFRDPASRPILATTEAASERERARFREVADVVTFGSTSVDPHRLVRYLFQRGVRRALLEGGPRVNGHFVAEDLIDEWNLTLSPLLVAGQSSRSAHSNSACAPLPRKLERLWESDGTLFGRWTRELVPTNPS